MKLRRPAAPGTFLAILLSAFGLTTRAAHADDPAALTERLRVAEQANALDVEGLKPWHLKLAVSLFNSKGKPAEDGTVEEWWVSPKLWKRVYTTPSFTSTEVQTEVGLFHTKGAALPPEPLRLLLAQVVHPINQPPTTDKIMPDLRKPIMGSKAVDCIMLDGDLKRVANPQIGFFPTYCFDPGQTTLIFSYDFGAQLIIRNSVAKFQGHAVAIDATMQIDRVLAAKAHVAELTSMPASAPTITADDLAPDTPVVKVSSRTMLPLLRDQVPAFVSADTSHSHVNGQVTLHVIIGRDGRMRSARPTSYPSTEYTLAAMSAMRLYRWQPYLLNGVPTEVDTTVDIDFTNQQ